MKTSEETGNNTTTSSSNFMLMLDTQPHTMTTQKRHPIGWPATNNMPSPSNQSLELSGLMNSLTGNTQAITSIWCHLTLHHMDRELPITETMTSGKLKDLDMSISSLSTLKLLRMLRYAVHHSSEVSLKTTRMYSHPSVTMTWNTNKPTMIHTYPRTSVENS